jgi:tetratricopeptide (TPR) repeat protein
VEALLHRAELYVAAGNSTLAEADTNLALQLKPDVPEVRYAVAKLYQMRNATPRYRQELGEVLRLNPFLLPVRVELAQALTASNQAKAALDILDATPDSQKTLTPVLVQRNWAYLALGHLPEMRRGIDLGLARGGRSTDLLVQDAVWKLRTGNSTGARVSLEEALKINPSDLRALTTLKDSYVAEKSPGIALQRIREHAARQPNSAPVQDFLGLLLLASGDRKQARAAFEAAKAADPGFARSDLSLAQLDAVEGKWNDAHSRLQALVSANAGNTTARLWLGNIEVLKGNHQAALDHFRRVVESDPGNAQALNNLAYALLEYANRPEEALEYARRAVERAQDQPAFADTLGWVLYRMGAYSTAVKHLERAALHKAGDVVSKYHLAMAYAKMGDLKRSRSTLAAALKINPRLPEAQMAQELLSNGG